ncbi:MAG: nicotinamide-nucleotide amidase [Rickettsiaceae bacterium]
MLDAELITLVKQIKDKSSGRMIATAESCTGGLLAAYLTAVSGSSSYFSTGIVSYSNEAKIKLLKVNKLTLIKYGAVSEEVASEMAVGCKKIAASDIAVSVTGIAGPDGGTIEKPVGTVCFGLVAGEHTSSYIHYLKGNRNQVRLQSCRIGLGLILGALTTFPQRANFSQTTKNSTSV